MKEIIMNCIVWHVIRVPPNDERLIDRSNILTVGTTDPVTKCVYLSDKLRGDFERRVIAHEIGHVACFSYGLLDEIHEYCYPEHWIDMEEFICNFVADYGEMILSITDDLQAVQPKVVSLITHKAKPSL